MSTSPNERRQRDWLTEAGLLVAALAAVVSSGAALAGLARLAGWPAWLAVMLPATVDLYAITATRVWLSRRTTSQAVRRYAAANALTGIAASVTGNTVYHGLVADAITVPRWLLVVVVSTVPPIVIGALAHLTALRQRESEPVPRTSRRTTERTAPVEGKSQVRTGPQQAPAGPGHASKRAAVTPGPASVGAAVDSSVLAGAVEAYRASVAAGAPLSERRLAEQHGLSRRQARKAIVAVRGAGDDENEPGMRLELASAAGTEEVA